MLVEAKTPVWLLGFRSGFWQSAQPLAVLVGSLGVACSLSLETLGNFVLNLILVNVFTASGQNQIPNNLKLVRSFHWHACVCHRLTFGQKLES